MQLMLRSPKRDLAQQSGQQGIAIFLGTPFHWGGLFPRVRFIVANLETEKPGGGPKENP